MARTRRSSPSSLDDLVVSVYSQVWKEFYDFDHAYSQRVIESLAVTDLSTATDLAQGHKDISPSYVSNMFTGSQGLTIDGYLEDMRISETDFNVDGSNSRSRVMGERIKLQSKVYPLDLYESYTPCPRNIHLGDDSNNMLFIPHGDDPRFQQEEYMGFFEDISWQNDTFRDPDVDSIEIEVAHRLHFEEGIHLNDIDATCVLSTELLSGNNISGLVHNAGQRDLFHWRRSPVMEGFPLPRPSVPRASDTGGRLRSLANEFCPNLNCIEPYCLVHVNPAPLSLRVDDIAISSDFEKPDKPCGRNCFLYFESFHSETLARWSADEYADLDCVLSLFPSSSPCDLATICRKPCNEVYMRREFLTSNPCHNRNAEGPVRRKKHKFLIKAPKNLKAIQLCDHDGPCDTVRCPCFKSEGYCERNCGCSPSCLRRWAGCRCSESDEPCSKDHCKCVLAKRECDPELCLMCDAKSAQRVCANCDIQRGEFKSYVVASGKWGFGVFLSCPVREHEFIAEYIGELVYQTTYNENRQYLSEYMRRNYLFGLNKNVCIDANFAGNHARFINHSDAPNCYALVLSVNGEFRIGIYAVRDIEAKEELFLNYGRTFFQTEPQAISPPLD